MRRARGLGQEAFADMIEIDRAYISEIEPGVQNPAILR
ncbi:helix-turn-helix domain-containing protein [Pelagibacterium lacus]